MGVFPEKECALAQVDISEYRSRVAIRKWATLSVCPKCSISVAIFFMGSTACFISPLKLGDSVSFETSSNVLSRWKRRARVFAPCSVDSTANFSLYRGINAQDRLQFSPALVNVIVPAIGSISEIEKPCIRRRHILAMAGACSSTVEDLLADPRRFVSRIRRDSLYLWGVLDQAPEKRVKCSAVVDVARCHLRLHPCLPQMVCASYHVSPPMSSPGCPYDNATVENFLGTLKTECLYHPAPPRAPRWNSSLPSTSIFIILNVSRSKNGLTLPEIRGWTV